MILKEDCSPFFLTFSLSNSFLSKFSAKSNAVNNILAILSLQIRM